ncbi:class I SAM-dependent RNA methyltransferase [Geobacter sp. AOG1]|uniref:THUMP domain-containing class I SAM-dependent RNA methyltransferase n=1 Tax=Geobacter sp. AOG1 TaxID=1566346 RepID=UPI001CC72E05|nr:THUMP domain-containing protein [Geobacter sp. AOG1]GFE57521.1 RNA methyltransferase [Geobacter sp. AOG1]
MTVIIRRRERVVSPPAEELQFFATTGKGVEGVLARELVMLGMGNVSQEAGGVRFRGGIDACYRANLWLRTANRVLLPLTEFACQNPQELYEGVRTIAWERWLTPDLTLAVDCNLRDSAMTHSGFVALKTKDAMVDRLRDHFGRRPSVDTKDPDLRVNVHLVKNRCTISLDTSGAPLDRRGYRLARTEAPLRETLAAALLELTEWDGTVPLVDPMCGSGTIPIEAALKAGRRAPGLFRQFGFERWPTFDRTLWQRLLGEARDEALVTLPVPIVGSDISARAVATARENCERAGVAGLVQLAQRELADFTPPPAPGILLVNPPYGQRLGEEEALKPLYRQLGDVMKQRCKGYTAYIFTGSAELAKCVGLRATRRIVLFNGPLECRLLKYDLY